MAKSIAEDTVRGFMEEYLKKEKAKPAFQLLEVKGGQKTSSTSLTFCNLLFIESSKFLSCILLPFIFQLATISIIF